MVNDALRRFHQKNCPTLDIEKDGLEITKRLIIEINKTKGGI